MRTSRESGRIFISGLNSVHRPRGPSLTIEQYLEVGPFPYLWRLINNWAESVGLTMSELFYEHDAEIWTDKIAGLEKFTLPNCRVFILLHYEGAKVVMSATYGRVITRYDDPDFESELTAFLNSYLLCREEQLLDSFQRTLYDHLDHSDQLHLAPVVGSIAEQHTKLLQYNARRKM